LKQLIGGQHAAIFLYDPVDVEHGQLAHVVDDITPS
jgi:hypothetical protein